MSFIESIFEHLKNNPKQVFVREVHGQRFEDFTGQELLELIASARGALRKAGLRAGHRAVLVASNSARWIAADLAILAEGGIAVPLYARQKTSELVDMIHDCQAKTVLCENVDVATPMQELGAEGKLLIFDDLFAGKAINEPPRHRHDNAPLTIIYTSGTSGNSKGVTLNLSNVEFMLPVTSEGLAALMKGEVREERVFHYLPLCFAGSRMTLWTTLLRGQSIMLSTDLNNLVQEIATAQPHYFLNVPTLLERIRKGVQDKIAARGAFIKNLYARAERAFLKGGSAASLDRWALALARPVLFSKIAKKIGPNLRFLICGSAPLAEETQRFFNMLGIPIYQVYGLTETTAIVTMDNEESATPGRVGRAIAGTELKVAEGDELWVRGPHVFAGYWGRDAETRAVIDDDGWFHTGDQVAVDDQGNWQIVGRVKNILVPSSGHNIAPEPLEERLLSRLRNVEHAVVVGHGKPFLSAIVSGDVDREQVQKAIDDINRELPHYRRIRAFHLTSERFTPDNGLLTANQKLRRQELEKHFQSALTQLYS